MAEWSAADSGRAGNGEEKKMKKYELRIEKALVILDEGLERMRKTNYKDWKHLDVEKLIIETKYALRGL